jgi:N-acetylglucosamine-6-phosphate deacetylase
MIFTARRLFTGDAVIEWPRIDVGFDGTVESIETGQPNSDKTTITPAFFDVHVHGAAGHDVMEGSAEALATVGGFLGTCGVGHYLATTVTAPVDRTLSALEGIADAIESSANASSGWAGPAPA